MNKRNRFVLELGIVLSFLFVLGCQPTPESEPVVNRSDIVIENKVPAAPIQQNDSNGDNASSPYDAPLHTTNTFERPELHLTISFDADVFVPQIEKFPVTRVEKMKWSDAEYRRMINYFAPNAELFHVPEFTKEYLTSILVEAKRGRYVDGSYIQDEQTTAQVAELEELILKAPEKAEFTTFDFAIPSDNSFSCVAKEGQSVTSKEFSGIKNGNYFRYSRETDYIMQTEAITISGDALPGEAKGTRIEPKIKQNDAQVIADKVVSDLEGDGFVLDAHTTARYVNSLQKITIKGWLFTYVKVCEGMTEFNTNRNFFTMQGSEPSIVAPWEREYIDILVDEQGVVLFEWRGATKIQDVLNSDIELLPFDMVLEKIETQLRYLYATSGNEKYPFSLKVERIALGTSMLSIPNDSTHGQMMPSWYVFLRGKNGDDWEEHDQCFVFTAYDGGYVEPRMTTQQLMERSEVAELAKKHQ